MKKLVLSMFLVMLLLVTGCGQSNEAYLVKAGSETFKNGSSYVITSIEELNEYVSHTYNKFDEAVKSYDSSYFENNALVIAEITKSSGSYKMKMSSVKIDENIMTIKVKSSAPQYVTMDMAYWHIIVECTQEEANAITTVNILENNKQINK